MPFNCALFTQLVENIQIKGGYKGQDSGTKICLNNSLDNLFLKWVSKLGGINLIFILYVYDHLSQTVRHRSSKHFPWLWSKLNELGAERYVKTVWNP